MIKFLMAIAVVFGVTALANEALADHDNGTPYTLTIVEFDSNGFGWLSSDLPPMAYPDAWTCQARGATLEAYLNAYAPEMRYGLACVHERGDRTYLDVVQMIIDDYSAFFTDTAA